MKGHILRLGVASRRLGKEGPPTPVLHAQHGHQLLQHARSVVTAHFMAMPVAWSATMAVSVPTHGNVYMREGGRARRAARAGEGGGRPGVGAEREQGGKWGMG